ncbi:DeoR/GlpR family DNA-binding transcription regulator [Microbacterium sp. YY-01]|uniref:DeoR/GlpR family DNA-binding transcription regulator n=1 Tax=Microbacterium sp. YY-01 TaxID=3421634 RepID=UPI003D165F0F
MRYTDAPERRAELQQRITDRGYVSSAEAAQLLGVSEMTVRRDLRLLEEQGLVRRVAGGATVTGGVPFDSRSTAQSTQKQKIAREAVRELISARVIALDAGTTVAAVLPLLPNATVVSHSLPVIEKLAADPSADLIAAGGHYQHDTRSFAGPFTEEMLRTVRCDTVLLSATAVTADALWGTNALDAAIKRVLIAQSQRVVLLADASKFGDEAPAAPVRITGLGAIDVVVTDALIDPAHMQAFEKVGAAIRIAP